jgi:hypothetical protein
VRGRLRALVRTTVGDSRATRRDIQPLARLFRWSADDNYATRPVADAVLGYRTEEHAGIGRASPCADDQQAGIGGLGQQGRPAGSLDHTIAYRYLGEVRADLGDYFLQRAPDVGLEVNAGPYPVM